ncbi:16S rRNA (cytidine(1402)-2'-O)-methyltransferase [Spirochaetia bacterium 38H-sp]|uniref:Ribosomal RNA small subunit methyltransferase I n=1 Tax=Rarispira pelagica TaxID=3141764 RepID=A0ABU9U8S5_9SPIR
MATLYMVATPIGNLEDITYRAVRILKEVKLITCEDTRHSRKLFSHYGIDTPFSSFHSHSPDRAIERVLDVLRSGGDVAYISDAGTPAISDPGSVLVSAVVTEGFTVLPVPGPSALAALVSVSGLTGRGFWFEGFLSPKKGKRKKRLAELLERGEAFVLYESPHRIIAMLEELAELDPVRELVIGRELTKMHEEVLRGKAGELAELLKKDNSVRGEFSLLVFTKKKK